MPESEYWSAIDNCKETSDFYLLWKLLKQEKIETFYSIDEVTNKAYRAKSNAILEASADNRSSRDIDAIGQLTFHTYAEELPSLKARYLEYMELIEYLEARSSVILGVKYI